MPIQAIKPKNGVSATAPAIITQQAVVAAYREVQGRYEARVLDFENEVAARRGKLRAEYLAEMTTVAGDIDES